MFFDVHIDRDGRPLTDQMKYLRRHDIVYHSPSYEKYNGMPIGEGDIAGLFCVNPESLSFLANKSDLFDDRCEGDFGAWGVEWEGKTSAQVTGGEISFSDGLPSFHEMYLKSFEKRLNLGQGRIELHAETPFSRWDGTVYGSRPDRVMGYSFCVSSEFPVERTVSLQKWGSRMLAHYYELLLDDPSVRLDGTSAYIKEDCALIRVELTKMHYVIGVQLVADVAHTWQVKHPHEVLCTLEKGKSCSFTAFLTIVNNEEADDPEEKVLSRLHAAAANIDGVAQHAEDDWRTFSEKSFVYLTNDYLENYWYCSMWQMFCCFRGRYPAAFNGAQFLWNHDVRNWGYIYHWNGQIPYWGVQSSNHPELFQPYADYRRSMLKDAQRGAKKLGYEGAFYSDIANRCGGQAFEPDTVNNLTCGPQIAMHLFRQWEYTRDEKYLRETALPVMVETARFYLSHLEWDASDGRYHMECSTIYENYLAFRDGVTDRVYIESLFRAIFAAEDALGEKTDISDRMHDVLDHLYDFTFVEKNGKKVITCGVLGDGQAMKFRECSYPEGIGMVGELSALFPGAEYCRARHELRDVLKDTLEESLKNRPFNCGHTPYGVSAAHLDLPVTDLLLGVTEASQIFTSGLSHFVDFRADMKPENTYEPRLLSGTETHTAWSRLHEHQYYDRVKIPRPSVVHAYLETMGHVVAAVNDSLLDSTDGKIRVFPAEQPDGFMMFKLLARGGCIVTSEKNDDVRYIALEATVAGEFTVVLPWNVQTCIYRDGKVQYSDAKNELSVTLAKGEHCVLCPRTRRLEVMYASAIETDIVNNDVKRNGRAQMGRERRF